LIAAMGIAHDTSHNALSKRPWLNRLGTHVFDALGVNSSIWHFDHVIAHHRAPNVSDYDANLTGWGLRLDPRRPLRWYHAYQHFYAPLIYSLASLFKVYVGDFMAFTRARVGAYLPGKHSKAEVLRLIMWKTIALTFTLGLPLQRNAEGTAVLSGYVLGHLAAGLLMGAIFQPTHTNEYVRWPQADAQGRLDQSFDAHTLATTVDFCVDSPFVTWITGGLNIHAVHHMFPKLSHLELPRAAELVAARAPHHGLYYLRFKTWPSAIVSHLRALAKLGRVAPEDVPRDGDIFAASQNTRAFALGLRARSPRYLSPRAAGEL
jgi:linoleoyl-CoA desaturase